MKLLVVGGQSRDLGKTSLVCEILRELVALRWTAVKITQCKPGECPIHEAGCGCGPDEHRFDLREEHDAAGRGDTSRFLAAGAARSLWVRVKQGQLGEAWPALRERIAGAGYVIIESNSILGFVEPDLYLVVLDYATRDFKESARAYLDRADAFVLHEPDAREPAWEGVSRVPLVTKPVFVLVPGRFSTSELLDLVRAKLES